MPMNHTRPATGIPTRRLILVLAMLSAFAPFATDMYLPGFAQMAQAFQTDNGHIESTLSAFFLGLALGQALYGPLIDRFGRRALLLIGVALFVAATLGCLLSRDIGVFTGFRVLQAIGGCAGMIIGRAIVNDLFEPIESARVLSSLLMLMTLAPLVAPLLGGWILVLAGWQAIFVFMLVFALLCGVLVWRYVPETMPAKLRTPLKLSQVLRTYATLCRRPAFIAPAIVGGLAQACMFAFITGSPFVFMGLFGVSEQQYGWLFALNAVGIIVGAQANRIGLRRWPVQKLLGAALCLNLAASLALVASAHTTHLAVLMIPLWFTIASLGFIGGNAAAIAMANTGANGGSGSALIGTLQFGCAFLISSVVATAQNGTAYPMALAMAAASLMATALWFGTARLRRTGA
ncbi:multidrug effflux MFS transporter [Pseudomonas typographi]|uniref:Bcr/CflA family efflux transporter n=1 Tax=Pseudomonas typographi TaxID=2715964 RepID=A0ABR7Z4H0_9PSED|nr:multidrug effflux MFS transporter [Pseudomonas typographi]MBD1552971.1 multidrug effflux MFS transporter [Pseudomonas typographi]MBD1600317.1 multidrug effflux MFS transporter [Pseudomonas typographi]